jgi:hypothetical protein
MGAAVVHAIVTWFFQVILLEDGTTAYWYDIVGIKQERRRSAFRYVLLIILYSISNFSGGSDVIFNFNLAFKCV